MTNSISNKGRKAVTYDEALICSIINDYINEFKIKGKIKYSQIHKFALEKFENGDYKFLNNPLSEDYWRKPNRQGKNLVDKFNSIDEINISNDSSDLSETVIKTDDAVNKLFNGNEKDKKKLIDNLRINEVKAKKFFNQLSKTQLELEKEKKLKEEYKKQAETLQDVLFQIMDYSSSRGFPIENIINTGKTRTKATSNILEQIFSDNPSLGFNFSDFQNKKTAISNTIPFDKNKKSAADDFGLF